MAEAVIGSIAEEIIAQLVPQALEKVGQLWGIERELVELKDTVCTLQAVLGDAEEQYYQSRQIQVWLEKVKDVFYEAQDILEELNIEAMRRELRGPNEMIKEVRTFLSCSNQFASKMSISNKVREVRKRIEAVKAGRGFHLNERPQRELRKREETHSFICEGDIKGRDEDKEKVMNFLLNSNTEERISILPIVGIGGLGKTALAQLVYNDEMVAKYFDLKMWVCVSNDFDMKRIVKNMIACAKKEEPSEVALEQLQSKLKAEIDGKKYLLVLDDVWITELETWLSLRTLLVGGARGSKILITTRLHLAAQISGTAPPHLLGDLSESASFDLLIKMACLKEEEMQDLDMLAIGKDIARKCYGVPLVVRTVGSLLFFKRTKSEWLHFKDYELLDVSEREEGIKSALRLSYDHLPSHLKQCFALCSLFPKDYHIKKETLIDLWMAKGFIQPSHKSQHLEDVANDYFMDLLWRNFFQNYQEDIETCKVHDLMHDLACLVAGTEYWVPWDDKKTIHRRTRHVSVDELPISHLKASPLRTILSSMPRQRSKANLRQIIHRFKSLRILDVQGACVGKVPRSICELKYLTYLDLSGNDQLKRLPNSITRLQNLQTLNLDHCYALEKLPSGMRKLVSLRNLYIYGCELSYMPRGLGQLSSLHRLTRFILPKKRALAKNHCRLGELNGLNNIRGSLCIENLGSMTDAVAESKAANLMGKHSLEYLELIWGDFDTDDAKIGDRDEVLLDGLMPHSNMKGLMIEGYKGGSFPRWMRDLVSSLPNLVFLSLSNCTRCRSLPQLGQLPHLKSLSIADMTELEYIDSDYSSTLTESFPSLSRLYINNCGNLKAMPRAPHLTYLTLQRANPVLINQIFGFNKLKSLQIQGVEFPERLSDECWKSLASLEYLNIRDCHRLTSLGVRYLSSLVDLYIYNCEELDLCKGESGNIILDSHGLPSLRSVDISHLPKQGASLPWWLLQSSNLKYLSIRSCDNLKELPEQIEALQSLQQLKIGDCPSLTSLPEAMRRLASLTLLKIVGCPELEKRCKRDEGEDWCKISHIHHISHDSNSFW